MFGIYEVCDKLHISIYTLKNWYRWEKQQLTEGIISEPYLPKPQKMQNVKGKPNMWSEDMIKQLKKYQEGIVVGRKGIYGKYSNPYHTQTKKYQEEMKNGKIK